ncbi:hypothetical protein LOTGIDRAFT_233083 [Lottia gigantea]|uniref:Uncharacterized protein n=1 Tax=Lottia gigantea TaxID=225164 RepID=V3ZMP7_LOTGI|nr:hypothetical protein LOTGIDRAFT_233083 [Lottia gigantea]ESO92648.1 hypothetical protein LOTGIDRAFT_233083 [Lottia gigantea]
MDPLYDGSVHLDSDRNVNFSSGNKILNELTQLVKTNEPLSEILQAPDYVLDHFSNLFPDIVQSNSVGKLHKDDFKLWEKSNNDIKIELDPNPNAMDDSDGFDVYIGGPAALTGAALQARSKQNPQKVLYGHNGKLGVSNWKGSASYVHIRDAVPVYYWPNNHGVYLTYATVKHFLQRYLQPDKYMKDICEDPHWNKLRFNFINFLKEPSILKIFAKNQIKALQDVGLHIQGTALNPPEKTTAHVSCHHASLTQEILDELNASKPFFLKSNKDAYALSVFLGSKKEVAETASVFNHIKRDAGGNILEYRFLHVDEIKERGYDPNFVPKAAAFSNDGYLPPYIGTDMLKMIRDEGGFVNEKLQLLKILVQLEKNGDVTVTKIVWKHTESGEIKTTPVNTLYLSLGPSMKRLEVCQPSENQLKDILNTSDSIASPNPLVPSKISKSLNKIKSQNLLKKMMHASGMSIVFIVRVDKAIVPESKMTRFRDHIDGHNKHIVRLSEKQVHIGEKTYQYFVLQTTGGGYFPSKEVHAETGLNIIKANAIPLLGLNDEGVEFDILQARSCARGVTAQNVFRFAAPASNMVMIYGIGGIGMTTMAPNALLMKAIMTLRKRLASGTMSVSEFQQRLKTSQFVGIPHWNKPNPFKRNYAQFMDNPNLISQKLGVVASLGKQISNRYTRLGINTDDRPQQTKSIPNSLIKRARSISRYFHK